MIISVCSFKGGVAKSTTAMHLAAYFQQKAPTLLVDGDINRSLMKWAARGNPPFKVVSEKQGVKYAPSHTHIIVDTAARPSFEELYELVDGCDLLVVPTSPEAWAIDATLEMTGELNRLGANYKILLTLVPPKPSKSEELVRDALTDAGLPLFKTSIRRLVVFQRAALNGLTVSQMSESYAGIAWSCYKAVGDEICGKKG